MSKKIVRLDGKPFEKEKLELEYSEYCCPNCGEQFVIRTNKKGGHYLGCRNWTQLDCKGFYNENGEKIIFKKKKWKKKKESP